MKRNIQMPSHVDDVIPEFVTLTDLDELMKRLPDPDEWYVSKGSRYAHMRVHYPMNHVHDDDDREMGRCSAYFEWVLIAPELVLYRYE